MHNINTNNHSENLEKSSRWNKLPYTLLLVSLLSLNNPTEARTFDTYNFSQQGVEVLADSGIVSNIERRTGTILPKLYVDKIKFFVTNNELMKRHSASEFTENFIVNQMKSNWGISKQNQLLFIWDAVYEQVTKNNFYDGEDGDSNRLSEFENTIDSIENCGKKYKKDFIAYMEGRSAEADRRSAEADRRSAEADSIIADAERRIQKLEKEINKIKNDIIRESNLGFQYLNELYNIYKNNSNKLSQEEIKNIKKLGYDLINLCKQHSINYKAKLSPAMLKFYGIE